MLANKMSVKSRILQFQQASDPSGPVSINTNNSEQQANNNNNSNNVIKRATITSVVTHPRGSSSNNHYNNGERQYSTSTLSQIKNGNVKNSISHQSQISLNSNNNNKPNNNRSISTLDHSRSKSATLNHKTPHFLRKSHENLHNGNSSKQLRSLSFYNGFSGSGDREVNNHLNLTSKNINGENMSNSSNNQPPPSVNRANKPSVLQQKKTSMTINLHTNGESNKSSNNKLVMNNGSSPSKTSPSGTGIPKPFGGGLVTSPSNGSSSVILRKSPATTPTRSNSKLALNNSPSNGKGYGGGGSSLLYGGMGWKDKYEESEKKRNHLTNLAQKATRDYEELRRRYNDVYQENDKLARRLDAANTQLDSLRKASEAVYEDYYKLKKRFEVENRDKSDAITRVDQYNKENRRLKRQSAALMMQINDPTSLASAFDAVCETDSAENDKEIQYLRNRVQELEQKLVNIESELEKARLTEFETQESVMLINDSVNSVKGENAQLREQLKQLDEENRKTNSALEDVTFKYEELKCKYEINEEKLELAEAELQKIMNEKNILQRQSLVFMGEALSDNRLMDALNQIGELQTTMENQRQMFEARVKELQDHLADRESHLESLEIETAAKTRTLEDQLIFMRKRADEAEQKLEEGGSGGSERSSSSSLSFHGCGAPPPPPPPPLPTSSPPSSTPPPPPPPPMMSMNNDGTLHNNGITTSSLKSAMGTLRKASNGAIITPVTPPNGENNNKTPFTPSPQIDDVISQLKRGIKLKPTETRTLTRKPTELPPERKDDDSAVEEMRNILNNLRRTRRFV